MRKLTELPIIGPMALSPDDTVCYCFHVRLRKIESYCRIEKPKYPSQISQCLSAGTGCGWCIPMLEKIHGRMCKAEEPWWRKTDEKPAEPTSADIEDPQDYAAGREAYLAKKRDKGTPDNTPAANE